MIFFHIQLSGMMMRVWDRETSRGVKEPPGHEIDGQLKVRWIGRTCLGVWPWCRGVTSTMMEATDGVAECQTIQDAWIASLVVDNFDVALCVSLHLVLSLSFLLFVTCVPHGYIGKRERRNVCLCVVSSSSVCVSVCVGPKRSDGSLTIRWLSSSRSAPSYL